MIETTALVSRGHGSAPTAERVWLDEPGPTDVLVEIEASAVCSTERMVVDARDTTPRVLGHAAVGTVASVGSLVHRVSVGDRVIVAGTRQCGRCFFCTHGTPGACDEIFTGMERVVGRTDAGDALLTDGGMGAHAECMVLMESNVVPIAGSDVDPATLAMLGCGITSGVGSVLEVARVRAGDSVAISGCGHLGLWMVQAARLADASRIIAIDPSASRREIAIELGATHAIEPTDDLVAVVRALTDGRGADIALEAAGTTAAMRQSFDITRYGGTVVPTGLESLTAEVTLGNLDYALGSKTIRGSQCGGGDVLQLIPRLERMLATGQLDPARIITATHPLDQGTRAFELLDDERTLTTVLTRSTP